MPEPSDPQAGAAPRKRIDRALIFSIVAIVISLAGTGVAAFEAYLTRQQQEILLEQRAASAWPHLEVMPILNAEKEDVIEFSYIITNKGVGPALLGDARYFVGQEEAESFSWNEAMARHSPGAKLRKQRTYQIDSVVIAPGEEITVGKWTMDRYPGTGDTIMAIAEATHVEVCYCSVYGRCWRFDGSKQPRRNLECEKSFLVGRETD